MSSLPEAAQSFLNYLKKEKGYSGHTTNAYERDLGQFAAFVLAASLPDSLDAILEKRTMRAFISSLTDRGLKPRSVARKVAALKSLSKYCAKRQLISKNAARSLASPRLDKPLPAFLTEQQTRALLNSDDTPAATDKPPQKNRFLSLRNSSIVELFYGSGIRLSELWSLTIGNVQFKSSTVRVLGKGKKERIVPLTQAALDLIREYLLLRKETAGHSAPLFINEKGARLSRRHIERIVASAIARVSQQKKKSPHVLRHSFATHLLDHGNRNGKARKEPASGVPVFDYFRTVTRKTITVLRITVPVFLPFS